MAFHPAKTWEERGLQVQTLKDKCNDLLQKLHLPKDDARTLGIVHVRQFCNTLAAVPIKLSQNAEIRENVPIIMKILGLNNPNDLNTCLGDLNDNAKASFVTVVQFALENCVKRVLYAIPGEKARGGFSKSCRRLIEVTKLADPSIKYEILMVPARIRNSLHAGGVPSRGSNPVDIDGERYVFENGKRVACASWSHLIHAFYHGLYIYEEMLCSPKVKMIPRIPAE